MLRPVSVNSFLPSLDRLVAVRATVELDELAIGANHGSPHPAVPVHALGGLVHGVDGSGRFSQIANRIVQGVPVDVVNYGRGLLSVVDAPSNTVRLIGASLPAYVSMAAGKGRASRLTSFSNPRRADDPDKLPRFGVVVKALAEFLWDNFNSHIKPSFDVVRGLGVAAPMTPIIYL